MRVQDALQSAVETLSGSTEAGDDPQLVARLLMKDCLKTDSAGLIARSHDSLSEHEQVRFFEQVELARTTPVFRVIGKRNFHGLDLSLNTATLEPRDDTEILVETVLARLKSLPGGASAPWHFADLGTGTGAVALALLSELPHAQAALTDLSTDALGMARANAEQNGLAERCRFLQGSWFAPLEETYDFIVSNPPYIASKMVDGLDSSVKDHDPRLALDGGMDGLDAYRVLVCGARTYLKPHGFLALEIGYDQADPVRALAQAAGWTCEGVYHDLAGRDRVLVLL
ncbi:MAG: peptide chain release factor N(5)-glutamine methyltransferase [Pseudomonadota bacterium]